MSILAVLLLLPQIIGSFAYFTLYFRVTDVTQKYRILLVSWSIIVWFLSPLQPWQVDWQDKTGGSLRAGLLGWPPRYHSHGISTAALVETALWHYFSFR